MGKSKKRRNQEAAEENQRLAQIEAQGYKEQYLSEPITNPYLNQTNYMAGLDNVYSGMDNVYSGLENQFAGMKNVYSGMGNVYSGLENTMEDLTVNQQQAQFEAQQFQQSQSNIMSGLRGAAGGSGIAALAQSLSQQGQIAAQRSSASIGQQESRNQALAAQQAGQLQMAEAGQAAQLQAQEAGYAGQLQQMRAAEASRLQTQEAGYAGQLAMSEAGYAGQLDFAEAQMSQNLQSQEIAGMIRQEDLERQRIENMLGMTLSQEAGYGQAAQAWSSQRGQGWNFISSIMGGAMQNAEGIAAAAAASDKKLKKNIKLIGYSPSGLKIYLFEYINKVFGKGTFQGVMSNEVPQEAVIKHEDGYDLVDYSKIDVEFKKVI